jgi:hypothetical protein
VRARIEAHIEQLPPPAAPFPRLDSLRALTAALDLSEFDEQMLIFCAALELDPRLAERYGLAGGNEQATYPTFGLGLTLLDNPSWDVLSPNAPLRHWHLVQVSHSTHRPLIMAPVQADERIVNYLKGMNELDGRLRPYVLPLAPSAGEGELSASQAEQVDRALPLLQPEEPAGLRLLQLTGSDRVAQDLVARAMAERLGLQLFLLPADLIPTAPREVEDFARLWTRESRLLPIALAIDATDLPVAAGATQRLRQLLARTGGVVLLLTRDLWNESGTTERVLDIKKPARSEQLAAWRALLWGESPALAEGLAAQFHLNLPTIATIVASARNAEESPGGLSGQVWDLSLAYTRPALEGLAQRIEPRATWDDIVLPAQQETMLRHITSQVSSRSVVLETWGFRRANTRGMGTVVLFAGESGTGKTMAAEILANELRLDLYRIDLSAVVSKYIGETEKNLRRLFDAAEDGGAILFFDEADALFGKRTEVKDSHDRYANIEVNYLLQRLEGYEGLAILATNFKSGLDTAFTRRLRLSITFPTPSEEHCRLIWKKVFPASTPLDGIDYDYLARTFRLAGGSIYNAALNASFIAAAQGAPVGMPHVLEAIRIELTKEDRLLNESDFAWPGEAATASRAGGAA